jgi:monothiol glutaredoxin
MQNTFSSVFSFISETLENNKVVLFMKGTKNIPQCGFSAQVVQILQFNKIDFLDINIFEVKDLREGIKQFSNWPTIPQLYVNSKFIGGSDVVKDLYQAGELLDVLK